MGEKSIHKKLAAAVKAKGLQKLRFWYVKRIIGAPEWC
jgi:hypothetical protein